MATLTSKTLSPEPFKQTSDQQIPRLPRCRTCKKILDNTLDRQKTRDNWWTNCHSCRTTNTAKGRRKRDAGLIKPRHSRRSVPTKSITNIESTRAPIKIQKTSDNHENAPPDQDVSSLTTGKALEKNPDTAKCGHCGQRPREPWVTNCGHLICSSECLEDIMNTAAEANAVNGTCGACGRTFYLATPYISENLFIRARRQQEEQERKGRGAVARQQLPACSVCGDSVPANKLAKLSACQHKPDVCKSCFLGWLDTQLDSTSWNNMQCPSSGCDQPITHADVKAYASDDVFTRFDELSMRAFLSADQNFRYCLAEGCSSGQIHDPDSDGNIFRCNACNFRVCTIHDVPFHVGETCARYDERRHREEEDRRRDDQKREEQNEMSVAEVARSSTKCPGCEVPIHKYEACDHMTCIRCQFQFCYVCRAPYQGEDGVLRAGNEAHTATCKYHSKNLPDYDEPTQEL